MYLMFELENKKEKTGATNLEKRQILLIQELERMNNLYKDKCDEFNSMEN